MNAQLRRWILRPLLGLVLTGATGPLLASTDEAQGFDPAAFPAMRDYVLQEMRASGRFGHLDRDQRLVVNTGLEKMEYLLDGVTALDDLTPDERAELLNTQEALNTILTKAWKQGQLRCRRESHVGTHFRVTQCKTLADWHWEQESAQMTLRNFQRIAPRELEGAKPLPGGGGNR